MDEAEPWADPRHHVFPAERAARTPAVSTKADMLAEAKSALVICGAPAIAGAEAALHRLATLLEMPVATTVSGQCAIAETDPLALGVVGSNGGVALPARLWMRQM